MYSRATRDMGAVMGLRGVKNAVGVAEAVMKYTQHSILVGSLGIFYPVDSVA